MKTRNMPRVQIAFAREVKLLSSMIEEMGNSFSENSDDLLVLIAEILQMWLWQKQLTRLRNLESISMRYMLVRGLST